MLYLLAKQAAYNLGPVVLLDLYSNIKFKVKFCTSVVHY